MWVGGWAQLWRGGQYRRSIAVVQSRAQYRREFAERTMRADRFGKQWAATRAACLSTLRSRIWYNTLHVNAVSSTAILIYATVVVSTTQLKFFSEFLEGLFF